MTSLTKRIISAAVFLPLFIFILLKGTPFSFFILVLAAVIIAVREFLSFRGENPLQVESSIFLYLWSSFAVYSAYAGEYIHVMGIASGGVIIVLLIRLLKGEKLDGVINDAGFCSFAFIYIAFLLSHLVLLRGLEYGSLWILLLCTTTWSGDTSAYFSGMKFGKRKLYKEVSPNKSIEGLIGGFFGGILAALIFKVLFFPSLGFGEALFVAAVIGIIGPLGDLSESMLKRSSGVKDSGGIIPGHGGVLDRVDSVMFSAPFLYYFAYMRMGDLSIWG